MADRCEMLVFFSPDLLCLVRAHAPIARTSRLSAVRDGRGALLRSREKGYSPCSRCPQMVGVSAAISSKLFNRRRAVLALANKFADSFLFSLGRSVQVVHSSLE